MHRYDITLPAELANIIEGRVRSGAYASVSDVIGDGLLALVEQEASVEQWLRQDVLAGHAEYAADPASGVAAGDVLAIIKARRASPDLS